MAINTTTFMRQENARLKEENQTLQDELRALRDFVRILNDLNEAALKFENDEELLPLLRDILHKALKLLNAPDGSLLLLDDETDELAFVLVAGSLAKDLQGFHSGRSGHRGLGGQARQACPGTRRTHRRALLAPG
jgi:hypothetical protein